MNDKICMVTGANSGIGKATALGLANMGATVVMVCRNRRKGEQARAEIVAESSHSEPVALMIADLSSQQAIRQLVADFKVKYQRLHVLVNNAGVSLPERTCTVDGIETQFAVNHLAPFLLTNLLLDVLEASAPARVVTVSSMTHSYAQLDFDNLQGEKKYRGMQMYNQSKLANVLFTYELARRLEGTGVTANCLHPGPVETRLGHDNKSLWWKVTMIVMRPFMLSPEQGAETSVYLASSPEVEGVNGKYFVKKKATSSSDASYDKVTAQRLWQISAELTQLDGAV